jgi:hypothetical protein
VPSRISICNIQNVPNVELLCSMKECAPTHLSQCPQSNKVIFDSISMPPLQL